MHSGIIQTIRFVILISTGLTIAIRPDLFRTITLSVNGGNEKTQFNLSAGFLDQSGIVDLFAFRRFNVLMNIDTKIRDWISVGGNLRLLKSDKVADVQSQYSEAYFIMHTFGPGPIYTPTMTLPDGSSRICSQVQLGNCRMDSQKSRCNDSTGKEP